MKIQEKSHEGEDTELKLNVNLFFVPGQNHHFLPSHYRGDIEYGRRVLEMGDEEWQACCGDTLTESPTSRPAGCQESITHPHKVRWTLIFLSTAAHKRH